MFERPPREREVLSWALVVLWSGLIYVTVPLARDVVDYVREHWSREAFTYGVTVIVVLASPAAVVLLLMRRQKSVAGTVWLVGIWRSIPASLPRLYPPDPRLQHLCRRHDNRDHRGHDRRNYSVGNAQAALRTGGHSAELHRCRTGPGSRGCRHPAEDHFRLARWREPTAIWDSRASWPIS